MKSKSKSKSLSVSPKTLKGWNISMGVVQLGMAIWLTILFNDKNLFKSEPTFYVGVEPEYLDDGALVKTKYELKNAENINIGAETVAFFYTTAFFHFLYALLGKRYEDMVYKQNNNYLRWIEYSITATLMIRIIAVQSGIRESSTLQAITFGTIGVMLQGQIVESVLSSKSKITENDKKILFVSTVVGWLIMLWVFVIIIQQFLRLQSNVDKFDCEKDVKIPEWVVSIIVTQCIFYTSFGFIQLVQIWKRLYKNEKYDYSQFELAYLVDSLASKVTLGAMLAYGLVGSDSGLNDEFECNPTR